MNYDEFLRQRRKRMAEIIRVAFRQLGGELDAPPITPPWFLPGAEAVWQRIAETERALRALVREIYSARFGAGAAAKIEGNISAQEREVLRRALRARPEGSDPLSVVDYLYLAQLPPLLFSSEVWNEARSRFTEVGNPKQRLQEAIGQIAPVRNEIAHIREVDTNRLLRANLACSDIMSMPERRSRSLGCSEGTPDEEQEHEHQHAIDKDRHDLADEIDSYDQEGDDEDATEIGALLTSEEFPYLRGWLISGSVIFILTN